MYIVQLQYWCLPTTVNDAVHGLFLICAATEPLTHIFININVKTRFAKLSYYTIFHYRLNFDPLRREKSTKLESMVSFSVRNTFIYNFLILQHFATKLGNFTNFKILFRVVVLKDFVRHAWIKI